MKINFNTGDCYQMLDNGKTIQFRYMKYTSIDNTYYLRICGEHDLTLFHGLTQENLETLQPIDCTKCDGKISATQQLQR